MQSQRAAAEEPLTRLCAAAPAGLSIGDRPGSQPLGIVLTIVGVVVLDFCADASEGPIRAYLLDVADTEEQDMALNIHACSAGETPNTHKPLQSKKLLLLFPWQHSRSFRLQCNTFTASHTMQLCWLQAASELLLSAPVFETWGELKSGLHWFILL